MRTGDDIVGWVGVGVGLIAVWGTPLVAAWRRRRVRLAPSGADGPEAGRPAGWAVLAAAGVCGVAAGALLVWTGLDLHAQPAPGSLRFTDWEARRAFFVRQRELHAAAVRGGALLAAAAQGLTLLALVLAWRARNAVGVPDDAAVGRPTSPAPGPAADGLDDLDAPFLPPSGGTSGGPR